MAMLSKLARVSPLQRHIIAQQSHFYSITGYAATRSRTGKIPNPPREAYKKEGRLRALTLFSIQVAKEGDRGVPANACQAERVQERS
jgi:hypothetical protein